MPRLISTEADAIEELVRIETCSLVVANNQVQISPLVMMTRLLDEDRDRIVNFPTQSPVSEEAYWRRRFTVMGACALKLLGKDYHRLFLAGLLIKKGAAYGDTPITRWGETGVLIRIDSKWQRYLNLISSHDPSHECGDEPITDTLNDIIGYCVLGIRYYLLYKKG